MVNLSKKYVIGTHVMWFEIEMYADFIDGMVNLLETVDNTENVTIDLCLNLLQHFEEVDTDKIKKHEIFVKFKRGVAKLEELGYWVNFEIKDDDEFYFHADYRRDLNYNYCKKVDYVMWGETDSFFPREAFQVIERLAEYTDEQNIHRYLLSFMYNSCFFILSLSTSSKCCNILKHKSIVTFSLFSTVSKRFTIPFIKSAYISISNHIT